MYSLYFITFQRSGTRPFTKPLRSIRPEQRGTFHTQFWLIAIYIWLYSCVYSGWAVPTLTSHLESVGTKQAQWAMQQPATATLKSGAALMSVNRQARPRAIPCQRPPFSTVDRIALEITNWWSLIGNGQQWTRFAVHENKLTIYACDATGTCCHLFILMLTHAHRYQ